ncbi:MAG: flagellar hook-associated protein FlgK [Candidatus Accumulibacter sp.]|jgi:flagellar hook-associated protein 1 FlgK|uniref:flagellar hook-associated protein FlgK n=1 Tax=Candidatus Accumulibacter TaxID=327159 RepID=UPI0020800516|nr:flagellar hook-associated protein FlgK [Accumulibacter sp.]MBK8114092.1 flagellar hook-associated protein FlgK [Accumulibacter sp.]MBK8577276.1 flagellar hook-associated protein FlgK [Candidatus Accumulibacter propinquus]
MGSGIIGTGVSGLHAAQFGLQTTEHNIANANTPGYTRQRTIQASNPGLLTGAGFLGQGTRVATIERVYSRFMTEQVDRSQSSVSQLDSYYAQIKQIDNMLGDASAGLAPALQEFFSSVDQVAANPSQLATRQSMVSTAQALSARYQALGDQLAQMNDSINGEITGSVAEINSYAEQIATLNQQIGVAEASTGQPANDLQDSRDQLVFELNKRIKTTTTHNDDGSYNVFIGNGQQLVVGSHVMSIATTPSSSDPSRLLVGLKTAAGVQELPESVIKGGSLGGLLAFRSESLDRASNELGRNAVSLALTFNAQSALGQDLLGQSQLTAAPTSFTPQFFSVSAPVVTSSTTNPPGSPAVIAEFITPPPFNGNFYTDLGSSDYRLSSDGTSVTLTRLSDKRQWNGADLAAINTQLASDPQGFSLDPSPTLLADSSYLIQPTHDAARKISVNPVLAADPRLIPAAGPLRTAAGTSNTGTATISAGSVGPGYAAAVEPGFPAAVDKLPLTLVFQGGASPTLRNFPPGARVSVNGAAPTTITARTDSIPYTSGANITLAGTVATTPPSGFTFAISGLPNNGDTFVIGRNSAATADGRNALALGQLQTQDTMSGKTASLQEAYAQLVSEIGNKTRQVQVTGETQRILLEQAQSSRDSLSGVNLDEEAANLIRYQQAYQASAKAMQIGASLFDTILQIAAG